jgi:hypothetical protein
VTLMRARRAIRRTVASSTSIAGSALMALIALHS